MHIPDGFVAPQIYIPAYVLDLLFVLYALRRFKGALQEKVIPYLASLSLFSFVISTLAIPLPGGTSVHGLGVAPISILFGYWVAFLSYSIILFLQAVLLGEGGITTFPINSLCIALIGSLSAFYIHKVLRPMGESISLFVSGFGSILLSALFLAITLGIHPYLFKDESGMPIYFPFDYSITLPALILPHIIVGFGEGLLNVLLVRKLKNRINYER